MNFNKNKNYSFSIIIPYYNTKIEQTKFCLESLICQDLNLLKEIIIVNDGSNEENKEALIKLVDDLTHTHTHTKQIIKLIHQENRGVVIARKNGVYNSNGEIILFVDPDDWIIDQNWIVKLNNYFSKNIIDLVAFKGIEVINEKIKVPKIITKIKYCKWTFQETINYENQIAVWSYAYKKNILIDPIFWNSLRLPRDDAYFNACLLSKKLNILKTNEIFYAYRINNPGSICWNSKQNTTKDEIKIYTKWFTTFENANIFNNNLIKDYWTFCCIYKTMSQVGGFRRMKKWCIKQKINYPSLKEIKSFLHKYNPYVNVKKIYIWLCINISICDYLFPIFYKLIIKLKNKKFTNKYC
ncbi:glycosyltransferase family A protein [Mycoplasmoides alvi]|uniref:glycosyltransferase family A protein n=1 Tax=Mycoplasmoides alvi TaxID=78580 RepID=UPI000698BD3F|nr:glycosyltransferase family A protein [Mycoplasmoides alvi]